MSVFGEWFGPGLKMKRWLFLVIVGTTMLSYSIAKILTNQEMELYALVVYAYSDLLVILPLVL